MIISPNEIKDGKQIEADLCIIGAGPAGITLALELQETGKKIVMLTGGGYRESGESQELNKGLVVPHGSHEPLEQKRRRAFGGASVAWGGRCVPFDPIDFMERDWIPFSGWPYSYDSIVCFYEKAMDLCKAGSFTFDTHEAFNGDDREIIKGIDNEEITSKKLERWSTPVNFAKEYKEELGSSENIEVILEANATRINTASKKELVSSVSAIVKDKKITVNAKRYILACGGIENPRILLASANQFHPNGIGNDNDVVGRYYMSHLTGIHAEIAPISRGDIIFDFEKDDEKVHCRRRWWITERAQQKKQIGNVIFFLFRSEGEDALFSIVYLTKFVLSIFYAESFGQIKQKWSRKKTKIRAHSKTILTKGWRLIPRIIGIAKERFRKRRLPFVLPSVNSNSLGLYFQTEQMPNPNSRITISKQEFDRLGIPRAIAQIAFTDIDKKTIIEAHKIFIERYVKAGAGKYNLNFESLSKFIDDRLEVFNSSSHHLGTTRISNDPKFGVVDENCKVHGIDNLFIAGSSVFPTGGHANPTLTIVALASKLAAFLKNE